MKHLLGMGTLLLAVALARPASAQQWEGRLGFHLGFSAGVAYHLAEPTKPHASFSADYSSFVLEAVALMVNYHSTNPKSRLGFRAGAGAIWVGSGDFDELGSDLGWFFGADLGLTYRTGAKNYLDFGASGLWGDNGVLVVPYLRWGFFFGG